MPVTQSLIQNKMNFRICIRGRTKENRFYFAWIRLYNNRTIKMTGYDPINT
jgi:hypothetical protein